MSKKVFISYCQQSHKDEVYKIVNQLSKLGIKTIIDKYDLEIGNDIDYFMDTINRNEFYKILIMCTKEYKKRADDIQSSTGVQYEINSIEKYLNNPKQDIIIPVIIENTDSIKDVIPNIFYKKMSNPYYVNFSKLDSFKESIFIELVYNLQGIKSQKLLYSELEALVSYTKAPFLGLPNDLLEIFRQEMTKYVLKIVTDIKKSKDKIQNIIPYHMSDKFDIDNNLNNLEEISKSVIDFSNYLSDKSVAIDLLSLLWFISKEKSKHQTALNFIEKAISIEKFDKEHKRYKERYLTLIYQKALSLHSLKELNKANEIYTMIVSNQDNCDILPIPIVLECMLYKGHINCIQKEYDESIKVYNHMISVIDEFFEKKEVFIELEILKLRAINALQDISKVSNNTDLENEYKNIKLEFMKNTKFISKIHPIDMVNNGVNSPNKCYPAELMLPVRTFKRIEG